MSSWKRWIKSFLDLEQPMTTINRWLNAIYCVVLIAFVVAIGPSLKGTLLLCALLFLRFDNQRRLQQDDAPNYLSYALLLLEFTLLTLLSYGAEIAWSSILFNLYTAAVMLNYPALIAFPFVYLGYSVYLLFFEPQTLTLNGYLFAILNFSVLLPALYGVRILISQRQHILALNRRIQSQAEVNIEMSKLRERNRLAEAMHDTIGHTLTSSIVSLEGVALLLEKRPEEAVMLLDSVRGQLQVALGDVRQTVRSLQTDTLADGITLQESLLRLVDRVRKQTSIKIALQMQLTEALLPIQAYVLYAVVREAITNALKHGQATQIGITLEESRQERVSLTIADNGNGTKSIEPGFGLTHLEQKVQALGGTFSIAADAQAGFCIQVALPLTVDILMKAHNRPAGRTL